MVVAASEEIFTVKIGCEFGDLSTAIYSEKFYHSSHIRVVFNTTQHIIITTYNRRVKKK
jgi:hypothetical protein